MTPNPTRDHASLVLAAALSLAVTACQKPSNESASQNTTPAESAAAATPVAAPAPPETRSDVTADPVVASQRNASKRRGSSSTASASPRRTHEVPTGTILRVSFDRPISTASAKEGETYRGQLLDDVIASDGTPVAASGSAVVGHVEHVVDSGKLARPAELRFRLTELEVKGRKVPITTSVYEQKGETHMKRNTEYIAGGAAVGALLGQLLGRDTDSTLKGAAAGAAAGTGVAALGGDLDFAIEPGRTVAFTLEKPLEF